MKLTAVHHQIVQDQCDSLKNVIVLSVTMVGEQNDPHPVQEGNTAQQREKEGGGGGMGRDKEEDKGEDKDEREKQMLFQCRQRCCKCRLLSTITEFV